MSTGACSGGLGPCFGSDHPQRQPWEERGRCTQQSVPRSSEASWRASPAQLGSWGCSCPQDSACCFQRLLWRHSVCQKRRSHQTGGRRKTEACCDAGGPKTAGGKKQSAWSSFPFFCFFFPGLTKILYTTRGWKMLFKKKKNDNNSMRIPKKLEVEWPYDLAIPFLGVYLEERRRAGSRWDMWTPVSTEALATRTKRWKQPMCPPMDEGVNEVLSMRTTVQS